MDTENNTINVGIKRFQKLEIIKTLKYGETINKFVQDAVKEKLNKKTQKSSTTGKNKKEVKTNEEK